MEEEKNTKIVQQQKPLSAVSYIFRNSTGSLAAGAIALPALLFYFSVNKFQTAGLQHIFTFIEKGLRQAACRTYTTLTTLSICKIDAYNTHVLRRFIRVIRKAFPQIKVSI